LDEVEAIKTEAAKLESEGVDILIALGHAGYERDQAIAAEVLNLDLVVGGHSHSLLYSGKNKALFKVQFYLCFRLYFRLKSFI